MILPSSHLTAVNVSREVHRPRTGAPCPTGCGGYLRVARSKRAGEASHVQYIECGNCSHRPEGNKIVRPLSEIRRRARRC